MKHVCKCDSPELLAAIGPLVQVTLLPHPSVRDSFIADGNMPYATVKMMVDTGADRTVVEQKVAEGMGLSPVRFAPMVGVSQQPELCPVYLMSIRIGVQGDREGGQMEFGAEVIGMKSPPIARQYAGLLGRDFLRQFHVIYSGPKGWVELHLSSQVTGKVAVPRARHPKKRRHK